jgi:hypothetical protein
MLLESDYLVLLKITMEVSVCPWKALITMMEAMT